MAHERPGPRNGNGGPQPPEASAIPRFRIERVLPEKLAVEVGTPEVALRRAVPYFGQKVTEGVIEAAQGGSQMHASMVFEDLAEQTRRIIDIQNPTGKRGSIHIEMSGHWKEEELTPPGRSLSISTKTKPEKQQLYRRLNPQGNPLIEVGEIIEPGQALLVAMKGKRNKRIIRLPKNEFPKGGKVTAVLVPDDKEGLNVESGFIFAYVDPIE